jgi:hypothetical protein
VKKEVFSNSLIFGLGKRTWHPKIFAKITKEPPTSWQKLVGKLENT